MVGPYHHGNRHYFQWMVRGRALVQDLLPVLDEALDPALDAYATARLDEMRTRYADYIDRIEARAR